MEHYERVHYRADSDYVFHHPAKGTPAHADYYRATVRAAVRAAGIEDRFRPFHDLRVTSATSGILAREHISKIMERGGWENHATMKPYIKLAGVVSHKKRRTRPRTGSACNAKPVEQD